MADLERFTSWEEIFIDSADERRQWEYLVQHVSERFENEPVVRFSDAVEDAERYKRSQTVTRPLVNRGDASEEMLWRTTYAQLKDGNVEVTYEFTGGSNEEAYQRMEVIAPGTGNRSHDWTLDKIVALQERLGRTITGVDFDSEDVGVLKELSVYMGGKPATPGWEERMLEHGDIPERVGFMVFPRNYLHAAEVAVEPGWLPKRDFNRAQLGDSLPRARISGTAETELRAGSRTIHESIVQSRPALVQSEQLPVSDSFDSVVLNWRDAIYIPPDAQTPVAEQHLIFDQVGAFDIEVLVDMRVEHEFLHAGLELGLLDQLEANVLHLIDEEPELFANKQVRCLLHDELGIPGLRAVDEQALERWKFEHGYVRNDLEAPFTEKILKEL